ncbi:pseudouridine synthase [Alphaproteobacteria bacterium]|jgi:tRNA pseudouridine32 synthase / 23S rRNA pseudouridine746 synthase|nr:pseudouridine synthase [Alphaproteobacteria bacterium]
MFEGETTAVSKLPSHLFGQSSAPAAFDYDPPTGPLKFIHQEEGFLVVSKPSGLLSVEGKPSEHKDCLEHRLTQEFPTATLVHRLDMDTSGLMLVALNKEVLRHLGLQFERRKTEKTYIARVSGQVAEEQGTVNQPLICDWPNRPKQMISHEIGKEAITDWHVLTREEKVTRLELKPLTGRSHQLRVHMLHLGHPILGDRLYGSQEEYRSVERLQLHAQCLTIHHPSNGERVTFVDPCPF